MSDKVRVVDILESILEKLDNVNNKMSMIEDQVGAISYDVTKTQERLGAVVRQYQQERERCKTLEATITRNTERIARLCSRLAHAWDRIYRMEANIVKKEEEEEVSLGEMNVNATENHEGTSERDDDVAERIKKEDGVDAEEVKRLLLALLDNGEVAEGSA
ncbi:hypothetical protein FA13DRAFT_1802490 [Coprinellus micaceus]|uniref:Uncharacterized protein n=1 Tax=Coprinellus micaceus TaxID=71717 RepID=A0A4Y7SCC0_COPMI|nr:hypothetical protein FA13DRAFT_1802490 [Coprinellus micaceus]